MNSLRDPDWYRQEAAHFRRMAAASTDNARLRDSYLGLSIQYERLADVLKGIPSESKENGRPAGES
jgi:hypothetical protein